MKKLVLLILMPFILGILNVSAQSELNDLKEKRQKAKRQGLLFCLNYSLSFKKLTL